MTMDTEISLPASKTHRFLRLPLVRLIVGFLLVFIAVAIVQSIIISLPISRLLMNILIVAFTLPVSGGVYYVLVHFIERREMSELSLSGAAWETAQGIVVGAVLFVTTMLILALAGAYKVVGTNSASVLVRPFLIAVSSAVFEEILFRGVLFRIIEQSLGSWIALSLSAVIFGGLHLLNENATLIGAVAVMLEAGVTLAAAFVLTRRLWLPIGIHFAWNFTQQGIFSSAVSGNAATQGLFQPVFSGPDWLTGGAFGVEASVVAMVVCGAVGVLFIRLAQKRGRIIHRNQRSISAA